MQEDISPLMGAKIYLNKEKYAPNMLLQRSNGARKERTGISNKSRRSSKMLRKNGMLSKRIVAVKCHSENLLKVKTFQAQL
jgi:hypothetical protein